MKIGVISHTLQVASLNDLPPRAQLGLTDVDLVLHVGNVGRLSFLRELQDRFGLVFAIYGDQDSVDVNRFLDETKVVKFANRKIGMTFGTQAMEATSRLLRFKRQAPEPTPDVLSEQLLTHFDRLDCLVFGNPQKPFNYLHAGTLIFNPGSLTPQNTQSGTMGILDITDRAITGRIIQL